MPITLIASNPTEKREKPNHSDFLYVAEMFANTLQGEGMSVGVPATFLRLQGCTLDCVWCDSASVWKFGNPWTFTEIFDLLESSGTIAKFKQGQHLILTGGSPLKQQDRLARFIEQFFQRFRFIPYLEIENESVLMPSNEMFKYIDQWNNSPKLANSEMKERARIKPDVLKRLNMFNNSWFKFVVNDEEDWNEIQTTFLDTKLISKDKIILMPEGETQEKLSKSRMIAAEMAIQHNVRFTDRLHITLWDKMTGV